ncbi:MAG: glycosyltransferase, partial [Actinomycetota bacterium]
AALALIEQGRDFKLVIAGRQGWGGDLLAPYRSALGSVLVETGYLSDDQVPAMLRGARVVAYPSREEGFGLPVLEALACGARVITTEDSVMAEVAKGAAELVPTDDHLALAQAIGRILDESEPSRAARVAAGLAVAAASTWARSAQLHLEAYRLALAIGTNPPKD